MSIKERLQWLFRRRSPAHPATAPSNQRVTGRNSAPKPVVIKTSVNVTFGTTQNLPSLCRHCGKPTQSQLKWYCTRESCRESRDRHNNPLPPFTARPRKIDVMLTELKANDPKRSNLDDLA